MEHEALKSSDSQVATEGMGWVVTRAEPQSIVISQRLRAMGEAALTVGEGVWRVSVCVEKPIKVNFI